LVIERGEIRWANLGEPEASEVANVSQLITIDRDFLSEHAGRLRGRLLRDVDAGLRLVLSL
jgi:mRNA-degrading endonuclease toxin of MazEF toxin-antitoxin module